MRVAAIVLAAGMSTRMGSNKLLQEIDGEPLIRRVVRIVAESRARPIMAVSGHEAIDVGRQLVGLVNGTVYNGDFRDGLGRSIAAGIGGLNMMDECGGALIVLGDMPAVTSGLIDRLIDAFDPGRGRAICVAAHAGRRGNPVLFARRFFPQLMELTGDVGARQIVAQNDDVVVEVEAGDDGPLVDIDTPDGLAGFLAR
ncbi:MAG TPA: nucleotidyltransferase family protein [Rhizomicrobium sp.]|jgi:molybdenum cofactor cytidylyltransferase|nr:nucleotidyltransferase family protein [Rhizomicrobium sp.]